MAAGADAVERIFRAGFSGNIRRGQTESGGAGFSTTENGIDYTVTVSQELDEDYARMRPNERPNLDNLVTLLRNSKSKRVAARTTGMVVL